MKLYELVEPWLKFRATRYAEKTNKQCKHLFLKHFSSLSILDIDRVLPKYIFAIALKIESKSEAKRTISVISNIFDYAIAIGLANRNPAINLRRFIDPHTEKNRAHLNQQEEFRKLLIKIDDEKDGTIKNALLSIIYTAQRRAEIVGAKWDEVDMKNKIWTIPAERMKMQIEQKIPITKSISAILEAQKGINDTFIFPSRNQNSINYASPLQLLYKLGYRKKQTLHGFRHIFSTIAHENGFAYDVIETQLAHKIQGVRGIYNKSNYFDARVRMMEWYDDFLNELKNGI